MHRRTDSRSPVQSVRDLSWLPVLGIVLAGAAYLAWLQYEQLVDLYDGELTPLAGGPRQAKANLIALFSTDDYPMSAIRREEQGTVAYRLFITRRGRVSECHIVNSSGSDALDLATCSILEDRARFEPARDTAGKRVTDEYSGRIRWVLPDE